MSIKRDASAAQIVVTNRTCKSIQQVASLANEGAAPESWSSSQNPYAAPLEVTSEHGFVGRRRLASRGARFVGALLDWGIFVGAMIPGLVCLACSHDPQRPVLRDIGALLLAAGLGTVTIVFWAMAVKSGQSPAKRIVGTRVESISGGNPGFVRGVLIRQWCILITFLLACVCFPLGPLIYIVDGLMIFGEKRQCLHDILASTIVVHVDQTS
jgi:uncharacterized RDD family membrane protein YckC